MTPSGSGWKFEISKETKPLPQEEGFAPNEPFDAEKFYDEEEDKAQAEEGKDWWRK